MEAEDPNGYLEPYYPGVDVYAVIRDPRPFEKTKFSIFQLSDSDDEDDLFKKFSTIQPDESDYDSE
jgi:hypothetical protein